MSWFGGVDQCYRTHVVSWHSGKTLQIHVQYICKGDLLCVHVARVFIVQHFITPHTYLACGTMGYLYNTHGLYTEYSKLWIQLPVKMSWSCSIIVTCQLGDCKRSQIHIHQFCTCRLWCAFCNGVRCSTVPTSSTFVSRRYRLHVQCIWAPTKYSNLTWRGRLKNIMTVSQLQHNVFHRVVLDSLKPWMWIYIQCFVMINARNYSTLPSGVTTDRKATGG